MAKAVAKAIEASPVGKAGAVTSAMLGTRRAARVDENLASLSVTLTAEQVSALGDAGNAVTGARYADMSAIGSSGDSSSDDSAP